MTTCSPGPAFAEGTLLRELNHRIDEQFASAINLISMEAVRAEGAEAKAVLSNAVELLHGHAEVHRMLMVPQSKTLIDAAKYLDKLCRALRGALLDRLNIQLTLKADSLPLQPERCWRLGLIVHELVTNATKHACFDQRTGEIKIKLARTDGLVNCVVWDNGSAATSHCEGQGQGLRIAGDLARNLGGRIEHGIATEFRSVVLSFLVSERERQANRIVESRAARLRCKVKNTAAGLPVERGTDILDEGGCPVPAASVRDPNLPSVCGRATTSCSRNALGESSPFHSINAS